MYTPQVASPSFSRPHPSWQVAFLLVALSALGCPATTAAPGSPDEGFVTVADGRNWGDDPFEIGQAAVADDQLSVEVSFSGGCKRHDFTLIIAPAFAESDPVQLHSEIAHDANGDGCEAYLTQTRVFDLELVRRRYRELYGQGAGEVVLVLKGFTGGRLLYEFGG